MTTLTSTALQLLYRPDLDLLTARWFAEVPLPQLQTEHEAVLRAGQQHGTARWLLDVRRRDVPTAEAAEWVTYDWLPRVAAAMAPTRLRLAYLISPARGEALRTNPALQTSVQDALAATCPYELRLFGDEGEAVRWLIA